MGVDRLPAVHRIQRSRNAPTRFDVAPPATPPASRLAGGAARPTTSPPFGSWLKRRRGPVVAAMLAVTLCGGFLAFLPDAEPRRFVSLYLTDLPGGLEKLEVTLAGCMVGAEAHSLTVEVPVVTLSDLQGPEEAVRVCSGSVPLAADSSVALHFDSARGFRDGAWIDLQLPHARLTLPQGLPPADAGDASALFDISLETSVIEHEGAVAFQPFVQSVYFQETTGPALDLERLLKVDFPEQLLDDLANRIADIVCERMTPCVNPSTTSIVPPGVPTGAVPPCGSPSVLPTCATLPFTSPSLSRTSISAPYTTPSGTTVAEGFPDVPSEPAPGLGTAVSTPGVTLSWKGGDAYGRALSYVVTLGGSVACSGAQTSCVVAAVGSGASHTWHVTVSSADGKTRRSPDWTFTTTRAPAAPTLSGPANSAQSQDPSGTTMRWTATDPDGDNLDYKVLLGTTNPPTATQCNWQASSTCTAQVMYGETTYYWKVLVRDSAGNQRDSAVWSFRTSPSSGQQIPNCVNSICAQEP